MVPSITAVDNVVLTASHVPQLGRVDDAESIRCPLRPSGSLARENDLRGRPIDRQSGDRVCDCRKNRVNTFSSAMETTLFVIVGDLAEVISGETNGIVFSPYGKGIGSIDTIMVMDEMFSVAH